MIPAKTGRQSSKSDKPSRAPASKRTLKRDVNTNPQRTSTPEAAEGLDDSRLAAPGRPKPPVTSHAKKTDNVRCPVIIDKRHQAHQDSHIPEKSTGDNGRAVVPLPRPEKVPMGVGVKIDGHVVDAVELHTRGQSENPSWFAWRQNRITASTAHRISHSRFANGKSQTPPSSYLAAITGQGPNVKTRAMAWGIEMEAEAVRRYQSLKSKMLGRPVRVRECGLFIDSQRPWLAASPDGIVQDLNGERLLSLEVKCPYKHRENSVAQACLEDPAFCLKLLEGPDDKELRYCLKPNHSYYTQIQCQMAVTGLHQADLVVFTLNETAIVPVAFDPEFWENTLAKLELFYRDAVLPLFREK